MCQNFLFAFLASLMTTTSNPAKIELYVIACIKRKRLEAGMSQAQFAFEMNVSYGFIGQVENPNRRAKYNLKHINKAALIFKCSFAEFFPSVPFEDEQDAL